MATKPTPPEPLTEADVAALRTDVAQRRAPRVRLRPGVAGVGATRVGTVAQIGDPAIDGPEFLHVAVRVNGTRDVLPFAPSDLALPASRAGRAGARPKDTEPEPPAQVDLRPTQSRAAGPRVQRGRPRGDKSADLIITILAGTPDWTIKATRGKQTLLDAVPLSTDAVRAIAAAIGNDTLTTAIEDVFEISRAAAAHRADELRAELAAIQASLAGYERQPRRRRRSPGSSPR